jgi:hypothetical protein
MADETTRRLSSQFALDRAQIENRRILGDDLARPREVEHFAYLPSSEAALTAASRLRSSGFNTSTVDGERHALLASRIDAVDEESARAFVREVVGVVEPLGGEYDGWGAPVLVARRPTVVPNTVDEIHWD